MIVNGIENPTPCCPSEDAETFEVGQSFVAPCVELDARCSGHVVTGIDWSFLEGDTLAYCSKVVDGEVIRSDPLPVPEPSVWLGLFIGALLLRGIAYVYRNVLETNSQASSRLGFHLHDSIPRVSS